MFNATTHEETLQVIRRSRPALRTADNPVVVYLGTSTIPPGLVIDRVVDSETMTPTHPISLIAREHGVAVMSTNVALNKFAGRFAEDSHDGEKKPKNSAKRVKNTIRQRIKRFDWARLNVLPADLGAAELENMCENNDLRKNRPRSLNGTTSLRDLYRRGTIYQTAKKPQKRTLFSQGQRAAQVADCAAAYRAPAASPMLTAPPSVRTAVDWAVAPYGEITFREKGQRGKAQRIAFDLWRYPTAAERLAVLETLVDKLCDVIDPWPDFDWS